MDCSNTALAPTTVPRPTRSDALFAQHLGARRQDDIIFDHDALEFRALRRPVDVGPPQGDAGVDLDPGADHGVGVDDNAHPAVRQLEIAAHRHGQRDLNAQDLQAVVGQPP